MGEREEHKDVESREEDREVENREEEDRDVIIHPIKTDDSSTTLDTSDEIQTVSSPPYSRPSSLSDKTTRTTPGRPTLARAVSSASEKRDVVVVPRARRRGWLARVSVVAEVEEPHFYPRSTKWLITFIVAVAAAAAPMGSGIVLPALTDIARALDASEFVTNLSVSLYMLSMAIFPLFWSSFSEILGRRSIYLSSFLVYFVFNVLSAEAQNIAMFLVMRILAGGASASVQAVGAGTIADIWEVKERGRAMGIFYLGPLCGPLLSPIVGGALAEKLGWRAIMWFQVIYGVVIWILVLCFLPETLKARRDVVGEAEREVLEERKDEDGVALSRVSTRASAVALKTRKYAALARTVFVDPLAIILNLRLPAVALTVYYASVTFGCLYVLNISIQETFSEAPYGFSTIIVGLLYIPNSTGYFVSSLLGGRWVDYIMHREAKRAGRYDDKGKLVFHPEDRMRENAWLGAIMYPVALMWYGWSAQEGVFWLCPMIANFFFGVGTMLVFGIVTTMLTEFMPEHASHGIALNNFVRNIFACVGSLVAEPIIDAIGNGWLFTILGIWTFVSGPVVIWAIKKFGDRWRENTEKRLVEAHA